MISKNKMATRTILTGVRVIMQKPRSIDKRMIVCGKNIMCKNNRYIMTTRHVNSYKAVDNREREIENTVDYVKRAEKIVEDYYQRTPLIRDELGVLDDRKINVNFGKEIEKKRKKYLKELKKVDVNKYLYTEYNLNLKAKEIKAEEVKKIESIKYTKIWDNHGIIIALFITIFSPMIGFMVYKGEVYEIDKVYRCFTDPEYREKINLTIKYRKEAHERYKILYIEYKELELNERILIEEYRKIKKYKELLFE